MKDGHGDGGRQEQHAQGRQINQPKRGVRKRGGRAVDQDSGPPNGEVSEVRERAQVALSAVSSRGGMTNQLDTEASALGGDTGVGGAPKLGASVGGRAHATADTAGRGRKQNKRGLTDAAQCR